MRVIGGIINLNNEKYKFNDVKLNVKEKLFSKSIYDIEYTDFFDDNIYIYRSYAKNTDYNDNDFLVTNKYIILFDGYITNKEFFMKENYSVSNCLFILNLLKEKEIKDFMLQMRGDFSCCVFNKLTKEIFSLRTPLSMHSFCYCFEKNLFLFSTKLDLIVTMKNNKIFSIKDSYFKEYLAEILTFPYKGRLNNTPYKNIYYLLHSSYIEIKNNKLKVNHNYWTHIKYKYNFNDFEECKKEYKRLLKKSLQARIKSSEKIELSLSGGLDSSAIACLIKELEIENNQAYNIVLKNQKYYQSGDETQYAQSVADKTGYELIIEEKAEKNLYFDDIEPFVKLFEPDETILYSSNNKVRTNTKSVCKTLHISGIGADQILTSDFGYITKNWKKFKFFSLNKELNDISKKICLSKFQIFRNYIYLKRKNGQWTKKNNSLYEGFITDEFSKKYNLSKRLKKRKIKKIFTDRTAQRAYEELMLYDQWNIKDSSLFINYSPFLDMDLVEFCLNLPGKFKYDGSVTKYIHREALKDILPEMVYLRKNKSGIDDSVTLSVNKKWDYLEKKFNHFILEKMNVYKTNSTELLFRRLKSGSVSQMVPAIRLISLEFWVESVDYYENEN